MISPYWVAFPRMALSDQRKPPTFIALTYVIAVALPPFGATAFIYVRSDQPATGAGFSWSVGIAGKSSETLQTRLLIDTLSFHEQASDMQAQDR